MVNFHFPGFQAGMMLVTAKGTPQVSLWRQSENDKKELLLFAGGLRSNG
jgi:hypothetical protein